MTSRPARHVLAQARKYRPGSPARLADGPRQDGSERPRRISRFPQRFPSCTPCPPARDSPACPAQAPAGQGPGPFARYAARPRTDAPRHAPATRPDGPGPGTPEGSRRLPARHRQVSLAPALAYPPEGGNAFTPSRPAAGSVPPGQDRKPSQTTPHDIPALTCPAGRTGPPPRVSGRLRQGTSKGPAPIIRRISRPSPSPAVSHSGTGAPHGRTVMAAGGARPNAPRPPARAPALPPTRRTGPGPGRRPKTPSRPPPVPVTVTGPPA